MLGCCCTVSVDFGEGGTDNQLDVGAGGVVTVGGGVEGLPVGPAALSLPPQTDNADASTITTRPETRRVPNLIRTSCAHTSRADLKRVA